MKQVRAGSERAGIVNDTNSVASLANGRSTVLGGQSLDSGGDLFSLLSLGCFEQWQENRHNRALANR